MPVLQINLPQTNTVNILVYGLPDQSCRLMTSSSLANWMPIATNQISANGTTVFQDGCGIGQTCRFYRALMQCTVDPALNLSRPVNSDTSQLHFDVSNACRPAGTALPDCAGALKQIAVISHLRRRV